mgnify:CR=1 FL=1
MELHKKTCEPCQGGMPALKETEWQPLLKMLDNWEVVKNHHLEKTWNFADFASALNFINSAGMICEEAGHHADFELGWGRAKAIIWTHKIDGLTEADFILAAKFDQL